jgi:hypothetical protein
MKTGCFGFFKPFSRQGHSWRPYVEKDDSRRCRKPTSKSVRLKDASGRRKRKNARDCSEDRAGLLRRSSMEVKRFYSSCFLYAGFVESSNILRRPPSFFAEDAPECFKMPRQRTRTSENRMVLFSRNVRSEDGRVETTTCPESGRERGDR